MANERAVPAGYMEDAVGRLWPVESVKPVDAARNDLVMELVTRALGLASLLANFKAAALDDIQAFVDLSMEKYGATLGGTKGNVCLISFDGRYKIERAIDEFIRFDERIHAAKSLIDDCLKRWSDGTSPELRSIVNDAFQVDKAGRINTRRILALRRINIDDEEWQRAMQAISDSVQVISSKTYIRFYERQADGSYQQMNLSIAA